MNTVYQFLFACRNFREVRESLVVPDISLCEPVFAIRLYLKKTDLDTVLSRKLVFAN